MHPAGAPRARGAGRGGAGRGARAAARVAMPKKAPSGLLAKRSKVELIKQERCAPLPRRAPLSPGGGSPGGGWLLHLGLRGPHRIGS